VKRRLAAFVAAAAAAGSLPVVAQGNTAYADKFAANCVACHGAQGRSSMALTPSLAGQPGFYAITQLFLFRQGRRDNPVMSAVAQGMPDADMRGYAEAIAALPAPPPPEARGDEARLQRGKALAAQHRCASCHGADFSGDKQVARLAFQREDYLQQTLRAFRAGKRIGYTQAMNEALASLSAENLDDLAHYLAHYERAP